MTIYTDSTEVLNKFGNTSKITFSFELGVPENLGNLVQSSNELCLVATDITNYNEDDKPENGVIYQNAIGEQFWIEEAVDGDSVDSETGYGLYLVANQD